MPIRLQGAASAALAFLSGCMTIHSVGGSGVPGEFYVAAQSSALGFPGKPFVLRCLDAPAGDSNKIACERILDGRDIKQLAPKKDSTHKFPGSTIFTNAAASNPRRSVPDPTTRPAGASATPAGDASDAVLDRAYSALKMPRPDAGVVERDRAAVRSLLRRGYSESDVIAGLLAAKEGADRDASVADLAMRMASRRDDGSEFNDDDFDSNDDE